ncbi:DHS-like NAD/FAD-binding domain-containing protein [Cubamyces menziesii]|nr:DHS-like NAD/FAD-binding domain-containing protein [Cubamyces menziesii]
MGNELSAPYDGPPQVLKARDVPSVVEHIKSPACRRICVMLGAGVSTAAGIPDFRSPGTGLYSNLQRLNLPYPEAVFEINYFRENPVPFYTLARELYPGRFRPTITHTFVKLLADHRLLDTCFTQNIDTLERQAGVPSSKIVEAHGSFASQHCIECHAAFDGAKMKEAVEKSDIVRCGECGGLVKPDIVFFGESLPPTFHMTVPRLRGADLLIVIGTSLTVQPFASLTTLVPEGCPRVLINMDPAGDIGTRPDDVVLLGRCDEIVRKICRELGWEEELDREWAKTEIMKPLDVLTEATPEARGERAASVADLGEVAPPLKPAAEVSGVAPAVTEAEIEDARVEAEVETLTAQVEKGLEISEGQGPREPTTTTITPEEPHPSTATESKEASEVPGASRNADDASSEKEEDAAPAKEKL